MIIDHVQHAGHRVNSWLIAGREEARGLVVDTGADTREILGMVRRHNVRIVGIVCTHRHFDHTAGNEYLARNLGCPVYAHPLERPHVPGATEEIDEGHEFTFSKWSAQVIHIPGHTAGQIGLYVPGHGVWTADTLFKGSVGGTVGTGHTTFEDLRRSVVDKILTLPPDSVVFPGHGETTTVATERERNPFVRLWRGLEQPGSRPARFQGRRVTIEVWAKDYDGGNKAQVVLPGGERAIVPGSRVERVTL